MLYARHGAVWQQAERREVSQGPELGSAGVWGTLRCMRMRTVKGPGAHSKWQVL